MYNPFCFYRYQGYISAALVLGGVDLNGPTLHTVYPHGSTDKLPYVTMGKEIKTQFPSCRGMYTPCFSILDSANNSIDLKLK